MPQLGILLPVMLLLTGRCRVIAAAAATVAALAVLTALVFGPGIWMDYFEVARPLPGRITAEWRGFSIANRPTAFMNLQLLGLPATLSFGVQALVSIAALAAVSWAFWHPRDPVLSMAFFVGATFLFTPYAFN